MDHQHAGFAHSSSCLDRSQRSTAHEQERGQVLLIFSRKTENAPGQDPAPVLYTWGVSWLENTFNLQNSSLHIPWLGSCKTLEQKHAAASQTLQVVKVVLRVHGLVGKFLRAQNDWAGSSLQQTYLSKKDKKNQKNLTWNPATEYKKHCLKQP